MVRVGNLHSLGFELSLKLKKLSNISTNLSLILLELLARCVIHLIFPLDCIGFTNLNIKYGHQMLDLKFMNLKISCLDDKKFFKF